MTCTPEKKESDPIETLLTLSVLSAANRTEPAPTIGTFFSLGSSPSNIPGASIFVSGSGFALGNGTSVRVNDTSATSVTVSSSSSLTFVMPELSSVTVDTSVKLEITVNGRTGTSTIVYTPLPTLILNTRFTDSRTLTSIGGNALHYKFNVASTGNVVYNVYGFTGTDYDISIRNLTNLNSTVASAATTRTDSESGRFNATSTGDYVMSVSRFSGSGSSFLIGAANAAFSGPGSCDAITGNSRCFDILQPSSTAQTACGSSTYSASAGCTTSNRVGRCIVPFTDSGVAITNYYSNGGSAFNSTTAQTNCNGLTNSVWLP
jgi:hypothetical protein